MLDYLPNSLIKEISKYYSSLNEIRIRKDCPVVIKTNGESLVLNKIILSQKDVEDVVFKVCKGSIHAYEDQIANGYVADSDGVRIGLAGEFVINNGTVQAVRKITSLCLRIPNAIIGVSDEFFKIYNGGSVLVISPPGVGKTSFIRDFVNNLCKFSLKNIVVVDERNEISMRNLNGSTFLDKNVDVLTYATKEYGFNQAVRTLNPDVIITDEILSCDVLSIINAIYCGVSVVATVHGKSLKECFLRNYMEEFLRLKAFDYFILISSDGLKRKYQYFDKNFKEICLS